MLFRQALVFTFLFVSAALANPHPRKHPNNAVNKRDAESENWAGAILNGSFLTISADFNVPTLVGAPGSGADAMIGIDGYVDCPSSHLEVGVVFDVDENGEAQYKGWYNWYQPEPNGPTPTTFLDIPIQAGDDIKLSIVVLSLKAGLVGIENVSKNDSRAYSIQSDHALCSTSAQWIVEDYPAPSGALVPFVNFGSVTFMNAEATPVGGTSSPPNGAEIATIVQNGKALTSTSIDGSSITVTRNT